MAGRAKLVRDGSVREDGDFVSTNVETIGQALPFEYRCMYLCTSL